MYSIHEILFSHHATAYLPKCIKRGQKWRIVERWSYKLIQRILLDCQIPYLREQGCNKVTQSIGGSDKHKYGYKDRQEEDEIVERVSIF